MLKVKVYNSGSINVYTTKSYENLPLYENEIEAFDSNAIEAVYGGDVMRFIDERTKRNICIFPASCVIKVERVADE